MPRITAMPDIILHLTPELRLFVNGMRVDKAYRCHAAIILTRAGQLVSWARRNFEFGMTLHEKHGVKARSLDESRETDEGEEEPP